ncbi:hypothetical protein [Neorhizobium galegae]|uniref:hypothetical protein n=1 Tax=Neorhizobium galegae TaxID=399 RepID=UPI002102D9E3|nr:hypothetical protein [Neorhizobium galegae]MCQ1856186.1 hypothetical protein [Neorhizobium galegae]
MKNTTKGAWIIHHGLKTKADTNGGADFSAIDTAAKAGTLFTQICRSTETEIPKEKVRAYARAINLNPNLELNSILSILKTHRLIDESDNTIVSIGGSTTTALESTAKIFDEQDKIEEEEASVLLAEHLSDAPLSDGELLDFFYSKFDFKENRSRDLLSRAENIGFVDAEPEGTEKLFFNGNLFRAQDIN